MSVTTEESAESVQAVQRRRRRDFRLFMSSHICNELGGSITYVALPLMAVLTLDASAMQAGLLSAAEHAAFLLLGLPAGAWVDRMRKRRVMMAADLARAVLLTALPVAYLLDLHSMPLLYAVALLLGCARLFGDVADQSYLPTLIGKDTLIAGNSKLETVRSGAEFAGPGIAGFLVQLLGAAGTLAGQAVTSLVSVILLGGIGAREEKPEPAPRRHLLRDIREGLGYVLSHRILRLIALNTAAVNLFLSAVMALEVLFLTRTVGLPPAAIGWVLTTATIGSVLAATAADRVTRAVGAARLTWLSLLVTMPFGLLLPLAGNDWRIGLFVLGSLVQSAGVTLYNICQVTYRQTVCPPHLLGRMTATMRFLVWGVLPLSGLLAGLLGELLGVRDALWLCAAALSAAPLVLLCSPLRRMREFEDAAPEAEAGATAARPAQ
ncbi:MFS transporter [Streptomyces nojiriensis]|uniref:MFS transporter n=1 Tax=Streptomyces nojiriensis TaxID=66374 RepID=A0ABQ3SHR6_9ACTN|nr:MFS transporter [Streptomyces nojiriensis]GGS10575.1 MFS transporter [Streptomyces nojiriensis]GHI67582.1 MFS transporter [Streptomyces nojiriensis]